MAEIINLRSKVQRERRRRLRHLKQATEKLRSKIESELTRQALAEGVATVEGLCDGNLTVQEVNTIMALVRLTLRAVRLDIWARLQGPKLAAIEDPEKVIDLKNLA
jgi:hypothetical protein